jgi:tRNA threonylcarbamoyladenosine biosynthesis protein TsaB
MTQPPPMTLLAVDTSTRTVGMAIYDGVHVLSESIWFSQDHHTVELAPAVADLLAKSGIRVADLAALGVALGPGSFTGLRIGLAFAKGLALAQNIPIIGVPTLDVLAASQPVQLMRLAAVLQAGRNRLAVNWYQADGGTWRPDGQLQVLTPDELTERIQVPTLVCGELTESERRLLRRNHKFVSLASPALSLRRPSFLAELAWQKWQAGQSDPPANLAPVYLHYNEPIPG